MKKFLYLLPAVLICMLYMLLAALAGGIGGFQPIAYLYIACPILAGIFLRRDKWWGCLFGIAMGAVLLYMGSQTTGQVMELERPLGLAFVIYYTIMGLVCYKKA